MDSSAQLKLRARNTMLGNYGFAAGIQLLVGAISYVLSLILIMLMYLALIIIILFPLAGGDNDSTLIIFCIIVYLLVVLAPFVYQFIMMIGQTRIYMNLCMNRKVKVSDLFTALTKRPGKMICISLLLAFFMCILMLPSYVIILAVELTYQYEFYFLFLLPYYIVLVALFVFIRLNFGLYYYILLDDPDVGIFKALSISREMMKGNRGRLFYMDLSMLGWILLGFMTLGIGFLWLIPFITSTHIHFYLDLKPQIEVYPPQWQNDTGWTQAEPWQTDAGRMQAEPQQTDTGDICQV